MCPYLTATARRRIIILWRYSVNCCSINLVTRAAAPAVCSLVARTIRKCQASKYHSYGDNFPFFLLLFAAHKVEEMDKVPSCSSAARKNYAPSMQALQLLFSWINKGVEPPIENQGSAHHCMIYSSLAALACAYYIKNGGSWTSFSKQQILDGCPMEFKKRESYRKFFEYLNSGLNITTEANYPSNLINDSLVKQKLDNSKVKAPVVRAEWKSVIGKEEMMEAVRINPLVAGMCIDENMRRYVEKDEVYYDHAPGKRNHAVLILGYGTCEEGDYWIVQSSWGRKWGKDGIGRIARGSNMCGIEGTAYYPVLVDTSEMSSDAQELLVCVGGSHPTEDAAPSASFSIKPSRTSKARKEPHRTAHHLSKARKAGKGITDLKTAFQNIFGENLVEDKVKFLQMFSTERQYISSVTLKGEKLPPTACNGNVASHPNGEAHPVEVIQLVAGDMLVGQLYSRLVPLILLLVDGSSPIDVTDSSMEIYLIIQKTGDQEEETQATLLGLAATYRLYRYPESSRLRLSQILILPPYQRMGYGKTLLEVLSNVAISEDVYDFTIEEPLDSLQHVRNCLDIPRLLACTSVQEALNSVIIQLKEANLSKRAAQNSQSLLPKPTTIEVRKALKINKKQFIQCWEILIYLALDPSEKKHLDNFKTFIADRVKASMLSKGAVGPTGKRVVDVPSEYDEEASFVMYKPQSGEGTTVEVEGDQADLEQQLEKLVEERIESIKAAAKKPRMLIKSFRYIFVTAQDQYRVSDSFDSGSTGCW